ncbi:hypothetical protein D7V97_19700 [Corallococcus sp. CA053C]|nr:hypothetical protein D7V97_19700 [Corallococcus sp. CA053C]
MSRPAAAPVEGDAQVHAQADLMRYSCGYALAGYACNNGRSHVDIYAANMEAAIAACHAAQPPTYPDFCYVIDTGGVWWSDEAYCQAASGSWRPANACCNFMGNVSCAVQYRCGYALAGYGCNNGRGSILISAPDMTTAISTCRASQPASLPDFCYVNHAGGVAPTDPTQCAAVGGSWRPNSECCNFRGSLSCPN